MILFAFKSYNLELTNVFTFKHLQMIKVLLLKLIFFCFNIFFQRLVNYHVISILESILKKYQILSVFREYLKLSLFLKC
jgi:hypothetical protein